MKLQSAIENKLTSALTPLELGIENESHKHSSGLGSESHFKVLVVSESFAGLSKVQRQRKVFDLLSQEMAAGIHALSLRLLTAEEWKSGAGEGFVSPLCHSKKSTL